MKFVADISSLDQNTPPHNIEAEQQLLGALLIDNSTYDKVSDILDAEHFFDEFHGEMYEVIGKRILLGVVASPVSLKGFYANNTALAELGGVNYLVRLAGAAIMPAYCRDYARVIIEEHAKREVLDATEAASWDLQHGIPAVEVANRIEDQVAKVSQKSAASPLTRSWISASTGALEQIGSAYQGEAAAGISTGIERLDKIIGSLRPGNSIVIAGRPSMGKTTIAHNMALHAALNGNGAFFASLEMTSEELSMRAFSYLLARQGTKITYTSMINGTLSEENYRAVAAVAQEYQGLPLITGERECRDIGRFRAGARRAQQMLANTDTPLKLVVIDYLQKLHDKKARGFYEQVSAASDACKNISMDLGVPVIALSQLSREVEKRDPAIPNLSDLRESGKIEEDADAVILVYRPAYYLRKKLGSMIQSDDIGKYADLEALLRKHEFDLDLIVAKQRNGPTATAKTFFQGKYNFVGQIGPSPNELDFEQ